MWWDIRISSQTPLAGRLQKNYVFCVVQSSQMYTTAFWQLLKWRFPGIHVNLGNHTLHDFISVLYIHLLHVQACPLYTYENQRITTGDDFLFHPMALGIEHQALGQVLLSSEHLIYLNLDVKNYLTIIAWVGGEEKARKNFPSVKWWLLIRNGSP